MRPDKPLDSPELRRPEPHIVRQPNGFDPELGGRIVSVYVDVRGLIAFVAEEVESIRTAPQDNRQTNLLEKFVGARPLPRSRKILFRTSYANKQPNRMAPES